MDKEIKLTLNDKGIVLLGIIILSLAFALGFMASSKRMWEKEVTVFYKEDLEIILKIQKETVSSEAIYAYKDEEGRLFVGWE